MKLILRPRFERQSSQPPSSTGCTQNEAESSGRTTGFSIHRPYASFLHDLTHRSIFIESRIPS
ncbi:hypothetical protein BU16DRAFT_526521 [Lophium mytilinum]|uniref:Uncharacterized protein n=1 Tax=Lophium mytilinum TaxID=390894 RepID=A0A6A6QUW7_9PEZI|nr:hypothetical protein BU16DRAFT_526521 [Lophium mytilinum]